MMRVVCGGWNGDGGGGCGGDRGSEEAGFLHSCGWEMRDFPRICRNFWDFVLRKWICGEEEERGKLRKFWAALTAYI